jgi:hypothetical protein
MPTPMLRLQQFVGIDFAELGEILEDCKDGLGSEVDLRFRPLGRTRGRLPGMPPPVISRERLGHAVEFGPFASYINEFSRGTAVGAGLRMKNSAQNSVVRSAFPAVDDHR